MKTHICPKCQGKPQPLDEDHYHRDKNSKTGFVSWCKKCVNSKTRKYKWDNPKPEKVLVTDYNKACREDELQRYQVQSISIYAICQDAF